MEFTRFQPHFLKINPLHNIPVVIDGSLNMNESRAIMAYLAEKYSKDGGAKLMGSTPEQKAVINQRLFFDATVIWPRFVETLVRLMNYLQWVILLAHLNSRCLWPSLVLRKYQRLTRIS